MPRVPPCLDRHSLRLRGNDYACPGTYYVMPCLHGRAHLFGDTSAGELHPSPARITTRRAWQILPANIPGIELDAMVVMPDHLRGIVILNGQDGGCADHQPLQTPARPLSLGAVIGRLRTWTMRQCTRGVREGGWTPFSGQLWRRNQNDRIVRNELEQARISEYIGNNVVNRGGGEVGGEW